MSSLANPTKSQIIIEDVIRQVNEGALHPGDRLMTYRGLCQQYGVSQIVLTQALDELEARGVVVRKPRSGCFIADAAGESVLSPTARKGSASKGPSPKESPLFDEESLPGFSFADTTKNATLKFLVMDNYPEQVAAWQQLLEEFSAKRNLKGELAVLGKDTRDVQQSIENNRDADVMIMPLSFLQYLGKESFLEINNPKILGIDKEGLVKPVRDFLDFQDIPYAFPCALSFPALYVNTSLTSDYGIDNLDFSSLGGLYRSLSSTVTLKPDAPRLLYNKWLNYQMLASNAITLDYASSRVVLDVDKAKQVLLNWQNAGSFNVASYDVDDIQMFLNQSVVMTFRRSYFSVNVKRQQDFEADIHIMPGEAPFSPLTFGVLMAVNRESSVLTECLDFVQFLLHPDNQERRVSVGDYLPVWSELLRKQAVTAAFRVPQHELDLVAENGRIEYDKDDIFGKICRDIEALGVSMVQMGLTASQALERLHIFIRNFEHTDLG